MKDDSLAGRTAFVSGSTAGIGLACAAALAALGARVAINGRTQRRVDDALATLRREHPDAQLDGIAADLSTAEGAERVVQAFPDVDVLVNNLGIFQPVPFEQIEDAEWLRFFETNVLSGVRLSRAYLPRMRERNWGRIVFISSESGLHIPAEMIHYGVTKTAQIALARGIAETLAGTGITVNSVLPGPTKSEGVGTFVKQMAEQQGISEAEAEHRFFETVRPTSLLRRFITPEEVANVVAFVCSPAASATTGSAVRVDGGVVRAIP
jgi:NAD(P)-dependent dehydrogenase (short-subunit alcohol dehydrogenase family)